MLSWEVRSAWRFAREGPPSWVGVRLVGLWILLVAVYAATLGIPAQTGLDYAGNEPHHLLAAESIVSDRDVDLSDEYRERAYASWYPRELKTDGREVARPAGRAARRRLRAADRARLRDRRRARRAGRDARAAGAGVRAGRGAGAADGPGAVGDGRRRRWSACPHPRWPPRRRSRRACRPRCCSPARRCARWRSASTRGALRRRRRAAARRAAVARAGPSWRPGAVVAWALVVWTLRERRRLRGARGGRGAGRVAGLLRDDQRSLLRRASRRARRAPRACRSCPSATSSACRGSRACGWTATSACCAGRRCSALVFFAGWLLYRSRRDQLARVAPARREAEACAGLLLAVVGRAIGGRGVARRPAGCAGRRSRACRWSPCCPRSRALSAWGLRHVPRPVGALLALFTLGASAWLRPRPSARAARRAGSRSTPGAVGPARAVFPDFTGAALGPPSCARCWRRGAAVLWWRERRAAGEWRRAAAASRTSKALH